MSTTTVAEQIAACLRTNWGLADPLAAADVHFDVGWVDRKQLRYKPQVIVSGPISSPMRYFTPRIVGGVAEPGLHLFSFARYVVNVWIIIPAGEESQRHADWAELMRIEVVRILNEHRCDGGCYSAPLGCVFPLDYGRALHELDVTPRIIRYEVACQANYKVS